MVHGIVMYRRWKEKLNGLHSFLSNRSIITVVRRIVSVLRPTLE